MKNKSVYFIILLLTISSHLFAKDTYIIVHGTWASEITFISKIKKFFKLNPALWYQPGGSFYDAFLSSILKKDSEAELLFFPWSGKNNDASRYEAAVELAELILKKDNVILIAHSHGATVGIIASHILYENFIFYENSARYKISTFYSLGVPVNKYQHFPNMNVIEHFYNLFSFEDMIQPVLGVFGRTFECHPRVANLAVVINGKEPHHLGIHDQLMGKALLKIDEYMKNISLQNECSFTTPGRVTIDSKGDVSYEIDHDRETLLARDKALIKLINNAIMRKKNEGY